MEFKRDSVIALYLAGKPQVAIVRALQHLNVNNFFVSRTIPRSHDISSVASSPKSGQKKWQHHQKRSEKWKPDLIEIHASVVENCSWAEHIARTDTTYIEKWAWTKAIEVPKSARAHQWTKNKIRLERASLYKSCSYRIWFSPIRSHSKLKSLWTNKMIKWQEIGLFCLKLFCLFAVVTTWPKS